MHWKRCYVSLACIDGIIYALGGFDGMNRLNTAEKYNPTTNQWSLIADMNERRSDSSAADLNGKVYVCGGFDGNECLSSAEFYDPDTGHWTLIKPMLLGRSGVGLVNFNRRLYSIGGYDGERRLTSVEKYDAKRDQWTFVGEMKSPRSNFGVEVSAWVGLKEGDRLLTRVFFVRFWMEKYWFWVDLMATPQLTPLRATLTRLTNGA